MPAMPPEQEHEFYSHPENLNPTPAPARRRGAFDEVTITLHPDTAEALRQAAREDGETMAQVRKAVTRVLRGSD